MKKNIHKTKAYLGYLVALTTIGFAHCSQANINNVADLSKTQPNLALEEAITDVKKRLTQIKPNMRLSYIKEKNDNDGKIQTYKFTPVGASGGKWTGIKTKHSNNNVSGKIWDNDALLSLKDFDFANAKLKLETDNSWIFTLPTFVKINVNSEKTDEKKTTELSKVLHAELEVTKKDPHFSSYRLYSISAFSPEFSVKITKFNMYNILSEAWTDGPLVTSSQTEDVEGSMGFLISIDEYTTVLNSEFKLVEVN